ERGEKKAAGKRGPVQKDEDIQRIAVIGTRRRNEAEIEGKDRSRRQHALEHEGPVARLKRELVRRTLGRLDDDQDAVVFKRRQLLERRRTPPASRRLLRHVYRRVFREVR